MSSTCKQLLRILEDLPPWERYPEDTSTWTPKQIQLRFPIWDLWPDHWRSNPPGPAETTWSVYGRDALASWSSRSSAPIGAFAEGSRGLNKEAVERIEREPAVTLPEGRVLEGLIRAWQARLLTPDQPEVIVRNHWAERKVEVAEARLQIDSLIAAAAREVKKANKDPAPVLALQEDHYLHDDTVDQAVAQLRFAVDSSAPNRVAKGSELTGTKGKYVLVSRLGKGGNGEVWRASGPEGAVALKILKDRPPRDGVPRFEREVDALRRLAGKPGILPLLDTHSSDKKGARRWFAMPIATELRSKLGSEASLQMICDAFAALSSALSQVHALDIAHRDIKPENLFWHDGHWCLGDFGLAAVPDTDALTQSHKKLGPAHYIAPEMLNSATDSDGRPADIYSLGKTLWVIASGQNFPLPGPHDPSHPASSLRSYQPAREASSLDELLRRMTQLDPARRPLATTVAAELNLLAAPDKVDEIPDASSILDELRAKIVPHEIRNDEARRQRDLAGATYSRLIGAVQSLADQTSTSISVEARPWHDIPKQWGQRQTLRSPRIDHEWAEGFTFLVGTRAHSWRLAMGAMCQLLSDGRISLHAGFMIEEFRHGLKSNLMDGPRPWSGGGIATNGMPSSDALVDELVTQLTNQFPNTIGEFSKLIG